MPFPASRRRFILRSPNGASIVLDADEATISMYGINGDLLAQLDAAQEFFGDSIFNFEIYDAAGTLRTQLNALILLISGSDGEVKVSAGSSGDDNSLPKVSFNPNVDVPGEIKGEDLADNGAVLRLESPAVSTNQQSFIDLYAENDTDPCHAHVIATGGSVNLEANTTNVTGDLVVTGSTSQIRVDEKTLGYNTAGMQMLTPPNATTTSSSFANITGATTFSFTKKHANTRILVTQSHAGFAAGGTGARVEYGVNFSGGVGDFAIGRINYSELSVDTPGTSQRILTGIAAGTYTVTPRWRRESGTSTVTLNTGVSSISVTCQEIVEA